MTSSPAFWALLWAGLFLAVVVLLFATTERPWDQREGELLTPVASQLLRRRHPFLVRDHYGWWARVPFRMVVCHGYSPGAAIRHAVRATFWCLVVTRLYPWAWDFGTRENWLRFTSGEEKN